MKKENFGFAYEVYDSIEELNKEDAWLLSKARATTELAYAPYSRFHVAAAARLTNGEIVTGTNQENASYPVGLCAERVLLSSVSSQHPKVPVETVAISYHSELVPSDHPIAPCGICRQSLQEYESRLNHPLRLILGGMEGKIFVIPSASSLLPFSFTREELG